MPLSKLFKLKIIVISAKDFYSNEQDTIIIEQPILILLSKNKSAHFTEKTRDLSHH
jgi:hypothetical protein